MLDEISTILADYGTAVLSLVTNDGYPLSLRCKPAVNKTAGVLELRLPDNLPLAEGEASLLCHSHNEQLYDLRSVTVEGRLEKAGDGWHFRPGKITPGTGQPGTVAFIRNNILKPRRSARNYLRKAGLPRPQIPWARLKALADEADNDDS